LPTLTELQNAWTGEVCLRFDNPVTAHELQIVQLLQHGDSEDSDNDNDFESEHKRNALTSSDEFPADNDPQDIKRLRHYVVRALLYVLDYFSERTIWYYHLEYIDGHYCLHDIVYELQAVIDEVDVISSQVRPCFQKIHDGIEWVLHFVPEEFLDLLEQAEEDIESGITQLRTFMYSRNGSDFQRRTETLQEKLLEQKENETEPSGNLWTHITISRDQTRSSDFEQVKLLILRSRRYGVTSRFEDTPPDPTNLAISTAVPPPLPAPRSLSQLYNLIPNTPSASTYFSFQDSVLPRAISPNQRTQVFGVGVDTMEHSTMSSTRPAQSTPSDRLPDPAESTCLTHGNDSIEQAPVHDLLERISLLEIENRGLKSLKGLGYEMQVIYCIYETPERMSTYLDEPTWAIGPRGEAVPKAHFPIPDLEGYLQQKHGMAFSVQKNYQLGDQEEEVRKAARDKKELPRLRPSTESMRLESQDMKETFKAFLSSNPLLEKEFPDFSPSLAFVAPYLFWYHHRSTVTFKGLSEAQRLLLSGLTTWIDENYGELYDRVEEQLARGVVSYDSMPFLVKLGDAVLVKQEVGQQNQELSGVVAETYLTSTTPRRLARDTESRYSKQSLSKETKKKQYWNWIGHTWSYKFDGSFYKNQEIINVKMVADDINGETNIQDLNAFPIRYASKEAIALLEKRGREFWKSREKRLVAYHDKSGIYGVWYSPHAY
jgi:hypothetical protein